MGAKPKKEELKSVEEPEVTEINEVQEEQKEESEELKELKKESRNAEVKQASLFVIVIILLIILLLLGLGFFAYENYKYHHPNSETEETTKTVEKDNETPDIENIDGKVVTTRLIAIMGILNNPYLELSTDKIGYIYMNGHDKVDKLSNEYIIYTALYYLSNRNELDENDDANFPQKVKSSIVDKTITNIFGDVKYNKVDYKGNSLLCPSGYYDAESDYYFVSTDCSLGDLTIETYNYKIVETPSRIDIYQAKAYVKDNNREHVVYRDDKLEDKVTADENYKIDATNYQIFNKYKFTFTKGSDGLFHFNSIEKVG